MSQIESDTTRDRILEAAKRAVLSGTSVQEAVTLIDDVKLARGRIFLNRDEMAKMYPASRESRFLLPYYALRIRDAGRSVRLRFAKQSMALIRNRGGGARSALVRWLRPERT